MLVDDNGKVAVRPIKADTAQGDTWIVSDGLKPGDRVIVEGLQKVKPGATVRVAPWKGQATVAQQDAPATPQSSQKPKNK
jgi:membrane fusion protein (multidrug efflux system)